MQLQPLHLGRQRIQSDQPFQNAADIDEERFQPLLAGIQPRGVENIVEQLQHAVGRQIGLQHQFALLLAQRHGLQQLAGGDDGVHRRADFMADHRQKLALGRLAHPRLAQQLGGGAYRQQQREEQQHQHDALAGIAAEHIVDRRPRRHLLLPGGAGRVDIVGRHPLQAAPQMA